MITTETCNARAPDFNEYDPAKQGIHHANRGFPSVGVRVLELV